MKDGSVYRLWSRTWAVDLDCDVPERRLAPWRKILARQGSFTVEDQVRIAAEFTWSQFAVTVRQAIRPLSPTEMDGFEAVPTAFPLLTGVGPYSSLRVQGLLYPREQQQAMTEEGMPVSALRPEVRAEALFAITVQDRIPPTKEAMDALSQRFQIARVYLKPPPPGFKKPRPMGLTIAVPPQ